MGITGFQTYIMERVEGGHSKINMINVVDDWKKAHPNVEPKIVVRLKELIIAITELNITATLFGGCHRYYHEQLKLFFQPFIDAGVKLVFFGGGFRSNDKLKKVCEKGDSLFNKCCSILQDIDCNKTLPKSNCGDLRMILGLYEEGIARQYGEYHKCRGYLNKEIVQYCHNDGNVMAILAKDSDFLLYDLKSVQYWSCGNAHLNFKDHTTISFHQTALLEHLKLTPYQFNAMVVIAGVILDNIKEHRRFVQRGILKEFQPRAHDIIDSIREHVRTNVPSNDEKPNLDKWTTMTFHKQLEMYNYKMEKLSKYYNIQFDDFPTPIIDPILEKYKHIWNIFIGRPMWLNDKFIDLNRVPNAVNSALFDDVLVLVLRRIAGFVLQHVKDEKREYSVVMKPGRFGQCKIFKKSPIYPEATEPTIFELLSEPEDEHKAQELLPKKNGPR